MIIIINKVNRICKKDRNNTINILNENITQNDRIQKPKTCGGHDKFLSGEIINLYIINKLLY